jgi:general secretion pathway protein L
LDRLLAIDIHDDLVSGVLLDSEHRTSVVRGYSVASLKGMSLSEAVADVVLQTGYQQGDCRVSLDAKEFFFRNLILPFVDKRKVEKVLPFELEELTSHRMDELHLDFLPSVSKGAGTEILAAMIDRSFFAETLAMFQSQGMDPEIIGVSGLQTAALIAANAEGGNSFVVLDVSFKQATLILVDAGKLALIRSLAIDSEEIAGFSFSKADCKVVADNPEGFSEIVRQLALPLEQTLISVGRSHLLETNAPCYIDGGVGMFPEVFELLKSTLPLTVQPCNIAEQPLLKIEPSEERPWNPAIMNRPLALAIWKKKDPVLLNFRKGNFKKQQSLKKARKTLMAIAIPLGLLIVGLIGFSWWDFNELENKRNALRDEVNAVFKETLPEVSRIVNPVQQLQIKIDETRDVFRAGSQGQENIRKLAVLAELSARIPESLQINISRLVADQDDVRIKAETSDFNTVDNVKKELEKSNMFGSVVISSANLAPKGGEVRFELKLEYKK